MASSSVPENNAIVPRLRVIIPLKAEWDGFPATARDERGRTSKISDSDLLSYLSTRRGVLLGFDVGSEHGIHARQDAGVLRSSRLALRRGRCSRSPPPRDSASGASGLVWSSPHSRMVLISLSECRTMVDVSFIPAHLDAYSESSIAIVSSVTASVGSMWAASSMTMSLPPVRSTSGRVCSR